MGKKVAPSTGAGRWARLRTNPATVLPFVVAGVLVVLRLSDPGNTTAAGVELVLLQLLALVYHVRAATRPGLSRAERRPWWLVSAALALLIAGGVGFTLVFTLGVRTWSVPMLLAIAGRAALVPVLLLALLSFGSEPMDRQTRWKLCMDVTTVLGAGLMLMWYLVLGAAFRAGGLLEPLRLGSVLFAVGDVVLLVGIATVLLRGSAGPTRRPLILLLAGTLAYLVIDTFFLYQAVHRVGSDAIVPSMLLVPVFLFLLAAVQQPMSAETRHGAHGRTTRPLRRNRHITYLAIAGGYGFLLAVAIKAGVYPWVGLVAGALLITLGVTARQIVSARENYSLVITDSLTGLANRLRLRTALSEAVHRSRRTGSSVAVLLIDLDGFKQINDTYGHEAGDRMLVCFADVLRRSVRASGLPARLGGDEFAVMLPAVMTADEATMVAERILDECRHSPALVGKSVHLRASIGVAVTRMRDRADDCDADELLHRADTAMYRAKRSTKNASELYSAEAMDDGTVKATLTAELAQAVDDGQLRLLYQPIVELITGELVAVEALVRWQHPTRGMLSPDEFVPLAEDTGLIHRIGGWVLEHACRQVGQWHATLPDSRSLYLSVNLSPVELERPTLAADVLRVLERAGIDPASLVVEITERALVDDRSAVPHLAAMRSRGVRVALDDFGTGYSSLRYLTQLPVDILKLDRCFVAELNGDPEHAAVAEAVIRLSQVLHLETVAEGIEEPAQAIELALLGYRNAQGYLFARPLPPEGIETLLRRSSEAPHTIAAD